MLCTFGNVTAVLSPAPVFVFSVIIQTLVHKLYAIDIARRSCHVIDAVNLLCKADVIGSADASNVSYQVEIFSTRTQIRVNWSFYFLCKMLTM